MPTIFDDQPQPEIKEPTPPQPPHPDDDAIASVGKLLSRKDNPMGLFATFAMRPHGIQFANQEPDEIILLFLRRHFITNIPWIFATFLLLILPPLYFALAQVVPNLIPPITPNLILILTIFYYLVTFSYAFSNFISWFYNIGVVTQKRIIDLDSTNILSHNTATANFNEIVDVQFLQRGFFQSTFDYGDINIQTEALHANFEFDAAPKPTEVSDIISDLRVATKGYHHGNP